MYFSPAKFFFAGQIFYSSAKKNLVEQMAWASIIMLVGNGDAKNFQNLISGTTFIRNLRVREVVKKHPSIQMHLWMNAFWRARLTAY